MRSSPTRPPALSLLTTRPVRVPQACCAARQAAALSGDRARRAPTPSVSDGSRGESRSSTSAGPDRRGRRGCAPGPVTVARSGRLRAVAPGRARRRSPSSTSAIHCAARRRRVRPPFLAHDVAFSPSGRGADHGGRERRRPSCRRRQQRGRAARPTRREQTSASGAASRSWRSGEGAERRSRSPDAAHRPARALSAPADVQAGVRAPSVTPSLSHGTRTILDPPAAPFATRSRRRTAHDACLVRLRGARPVVWNATNGTGVRRPTRRYVVAPLQLTGRDLIRHRPGRPSRASRPRRAYRLRRCDCADRARRAGPRPPRSAQPSTFLTRPASRAGWHCAAGAGASAAARARPARSAVQRLFARGRR